MHFVFRVMCLSLHLLHYLIIFPIQINSRIKELDLSHNEFSEKGGEHLGQLLGMTSKIQTYLCCKSMFSYHSKTIVGTL